jgi:hypothetical protein
MGASATYAIETMKPMRTVISVAIVLSNILAGIADISRQIALGGGNK